MEKQDLSNTHEVFLKKNSCVVLKKNLIFSKSVKDSKLAAECNACTMVLFFKNVFFHKKNQDLFKFGKK